MITRRGLLGVGLAWSALPAWAHHGWRWTSSGTFELTGVVRSARLGNPHGILTVDVNGEMWRVEVGQPWRNERAGLRDDMMAPGAELTVRGERHADETQRVVKAEVVVIGGQDYVLYPDRV